MLSAHEIRPGFPALISGRGSTHRRVSHFARIQQLGHEANVAFERGSFETDARRPSLRERRDHQVETDLRAVRKIVEIDDVPVAKPPEQDLVHVL